MSITIEAHEVKTQWSELLKRVEAGEGITITRHGSPVAKLVPVRRKASVKERAAAVARIHKLRAEVSLNGVRIKDLIAEGRK